MPGPVRPMTSKGIWGRSAVFPQCTGQTDGPTDRPRESLMTIGRYDSNESDAATLGNRLYAQRKGPNVTTPIC